MLSSVTTGAGGTSPASTVIVNSASAYVPSSGS